MVITLTTAFDAGSHDSGQTYPKAKITQLNVDLISKEMRVILQYGDDSSGWVRGAGSKDILEVIVDDPSVPHTKYTDLVDSATNDGELLGAALERLVYAHMQTEYAELAGTVA
jgi:hypothetical protein